MELATGWSPSHNAWVSGFGTGLQNIRPSDPRYEGFYDLDVIFHRILSYGRNENLDDLLLTRKLVTLLRIAFIARPADVAQIIYSEPFVNEDGLKIVMGRLKPDRSVQIHRDLPVIPFLQEHPQACVARCYNTYVDRQVCVRAELR